MSPFARAKPKVRPFAIWATYGPRRWYCRISVTKGADLRVLILLRFDKRETNKSKKWFHLKYKSAESKWRWVHPIAGQM